MVFLWRSILNSLLLNEKNLISRSKHWSSRMMCGVMLKIIFTLEPENETSQANSTYTRRRTSGCIVVLSNPWNWENCISRWNLPSGRTSKGPSRVNILGPRLFAQCRCPNNHKPIRRGNPLRRRDKLRYVCDYLTQARCGGTLLWLAYCIPCYGRIACFVLGT